MSLTPVASIDLHGCRKEQAMYKVTRFLESVVQNNIITRKKVWVCIITGSGSHSQDGSVLREAVRSLLTRREMEYMIQHGKGAFLVNATSGHELVGLPFHAVDSKVIVTDEFCDQVPLVVHQLPPSRSLPTTTTTTLLGCATQPLPAEVAADDDVMERIKTKSAQEHTQSIGEEQRELNRAISISKKEVERLRQEEEKQLDAILQQSQYEQSLQQEEEEKRLAEALLHSQEQVEIQRRQNEQSKREEEERLAAVLLASQEEEKAVEQREKLLLERAISISQLEVISQHDNKALDEALAQSMHDVNAENSELNHVLEISLREETMSEDEIIQQALLLSLNETYDTVANVD